ncbi:hypothetical protein [Cryobacterium sp. PH31-O1]|uniref:hypothetical protein n=1 Tax=Cryobacterium sp. PH31-O1 TaxID=3046306 RepID=UPI0024BA96AB|nr:hypothetical protein [Cryobacterium sp. PH31-O1]MDJ0337416.1 hypothetical protein [Cryobacterium sp. PH31-O1]
MTMSELISLGALVIAAASWADSIRRINSASIAFRIELDPAFDGWYRIRNVGSRTVREVAIDPASVAEYQLGGSWLFGDMKAGSSRRFTLKSLSGDRPDEITLKYGVLLAKKRVVPFHPVAVESPGEPKPID